jgi:dTDP-4-dehydrorhamnose 3,5-epimerase
MRVHRFDIDGALLIEPKRYRDDRGFYSETYNALALARQGIETRFVQDTHLLCTAAGSVRGLHFQAPPFAQARLMRVVRGAVQVIAVDLRKGSPGYRRHASAELSAEDGLQLYSPEGFALGFVTLRPLTEISLKLSALDAAEHHGGIFWADPLLGIDWQVQREEAVLSTKDAALPMLRDVETPFLYEPSRSGVAA